MGMTASERTARYNARKYAEYETLPKIECECGCGTLIAPVTKMHKPAHYAHGHNPHGVATRIQPGDREMSRKGTAAMRAAGTLSGPGHYAWRGGEWMVNGGYIRRTLTAAEVAIMPTAVKHGNGWSIPRSHYVWNLTHPDDRVNPGEVIHHINRIRDDDVSHNLQKMTRRDHEALHIAGRRKRLEVTQDGEVLAE